jgi:hypothetical protein
MSSPSTPINPVDDRPERIRAYLEKALPPGKKEQASYLTDAIVQAGHLYDRQTAGRNDWLNYTHRRERLKRLMKSVAEAASHLIKLDVMTQDELSDQLGPKKLEELIGALNMLFDKVRILENQMQRDGRPLDLAEERWIKALAKIYENAFDKSPFGESRIEPGRSRGNFYRLLQVSRPALFARYGKLSLKQIKRKLKGKAGTPII